MRGIFVVSLFLFAAGAAGMAAGSRATAPDVRRRRWLKYGVYAAVVYAVFGAAVAGGEWLAALMALVVAGCGAELLRVTAAQGAGYRAAALLVLGALGAGLIRFALAGGTGFVEVFFITAAFDAFSQVFGQWLGRTPLVPRISPGKTRGGLVGGLVVAGIVSSLLAWLGGRPASSGCVPGLGLGLLALAGDLLASSVKRRVGVKDFGTILPGHGGLLDRFDSLLATGGAAGWALWVSAVLA